MTRVAAVDCGTNSIRLLIADVDPTTRALTDVERRMTIVRLGQGVDATGRLDPDAIARTLTATREYADLCRARDVSADRIRFVATSATRDAENAADFTDGVMAALGAPVEVVTGREEAELSFTGATAGLVGHEGPYLVLDIGGGSTEFVLGTETVKAAYSTDMGCVRMTERHLKGDPPTPEQVANAVIDIDEHIMKASAQVPVEEAVTLVGLAGSVTTITAHALGLTEYDSARIHGATLPLGDVTASCRALLTATREQRAAMGFMHPGRVDVIGAGALIWSRVVQRVAEKAAVTTAVTSEHDILDGIALSVVTR